MTEELLQYLWKYRLYKPGLYSTHDGQPLEIIHPGLHNTDSGPDFFNAKVKIGNTLWAGNVEIHQRSSEWIKHGHHNDRLYDNVILHVVAQNDTDIKNSLGVLIPVWEMPVDEMPLKNYESLLKNHHWIACASFIGNVHHLEINSWIERMTAEKLELKSDVIGKMLKIYNNDWDEVFYVMLTRNFGFGVNSEPFEQLARQTPWRIVLKNIDNISSLEALFLGQAGFLSDLVYEDYYIQKLQQDYSFLSKKYKLKRVPMHLWKFLRLRPSNFPTIRLVQLARLFHKCNASFSRVLTVDSINLLFEIFNVEAGDYWNIHYRPGAESAYKIKHIGRLSVELLIINTIVPVLFAYGKLRDNDLFCQKALCWLETLKPESNSIIKGWGNLGVQAENASQSQGLVFLKQNYCQHSKCLYCRIGHLVISKKSF